MCVVSVWDCKVYNAHTIEQSPAKSNTRNARAEYIYEERAQICSISLYAHSARVCRQLTRWSSVFARSHGPHDYAIYFYIMRSICYYVYIRILAYVTSCTSRKWPPASIAYVCWRASCGGRIIMSENSVPGTSSCDRIRLGCPVETIPIIPTLQFPAFLCVFLNHLWHKSGTKEFRGIPCFHIFHINNIVTATHQIAISGSAFESIVSHRVS